MNITLYLFHNVIPNKRLYLYRCMNTPCQRPLFKYTSSDLVVANAGATSFEQYEPGSKYIEIQCHSCGQEYKILFQ
jgi:hypothetical protein